MWTTITSPAIFWSICIPSSRPRLGLAILVRLPAVPQNQAGDVVALRCPLGERPHRSEQPFEHGVGLGAVASGHRLDQPFTAEFLAGSIPRLGHTVAADDHQIA